MGRMSALTTLRRRLPGAPPAWLAGLALLLAALPASGQPATPPTTLTTTTTTTAAPQVHTRAVVRSLPSAAEPGLIRLKLLPGGQLPFSTLAFAVSDAALLRGLAVGDEIGFVAERRHGVDTVVRLRKVAPCVRGQHCPAIVEQTACGQPAAGAARARRRHPPRGRAWRRGVATAI